MSRPKTSLIGKTNQLPRTAVATCLPSIQPILRCVRVKGQLFYFLNIYSLFNLNPSDYKQKKPECQRISNRTGAYTIQGYGMELLVPLNT